MTKPIGTLLIDDNPTFLRLAGRFLEEYGSSEVELVGIAGGGEDGLEQARELRPDVVVLDLAMPGMDGIETLKRLHEIDPDLHVMVLTGHGTIPAAVEAANLGAMDFFQKPTDIEVLIERIKEARSEKIMLAEKKSREHVEEILRTRGW